MHPLVLEYCSDDHGDTWHIGFVFNHTTDPSWGNECQAAELQNNTVLLNARDLTFSREQAYSSNGGLSFTSMKPVRILSLRVAPHMHIR